MCRSKLATEQQFQEIQDLLVPLVQGCTGFEGHVHTISDTVQLLASRVTSVEQMVNSLAAKMAEFEKEGLISGQEIGRSTAAGSGDPAPADENRNTRRKLDTDAGPDACDIVSQHARTSASFSYRLHNAHALAQGFNSSSVVSQASL